MKHTRLLFSISLVQFCLGTAFGQDTLNKREVYNHEVGDIFHMKILVSWTNKTTVFLKRQIVSKYVSANQDTFKYRVLDSAYKSKDMGMILEISTDTLIYSGLNSRAYTDNIQYMNCDSLVWKKDSNNADIETWYFSNTEGYRSLGYYKGLGHYYNFFDGSLGTFHRTLLYYKQNGKEWGEKIILSSPKNLNIQTFELYPNPASDFIHVSGNFQGTFFINDIYGKTIKHGKLENEIGISDLKSGVYFVQLLNQKSNSYETHKIIVQH